MLADDRARRAAGDDALRGALLVVGEGGPGGYGDDTVIADADMLAAELPDVRFERASSILEWRLRPDRLTTAAAAFALECWAVPAPARRARKR